MSLVALAAVGGLALSAYAMGSLNSAETVAETCNPQMLAVGRLGRGLGGGFGRGLGRIEVSEEYEKSVTDIAKADSDVQSLLSTGYNFTAVRPIIMSRVEANGDISTKASKAIVTLLKEDSGRASVLVDLTEGKVTQIVIMTRTVIDKR